MYGTIFTLHSYWAFIVTFLVAVTLVATIYHLATKKPITPAYRKAAFYTTMAMHLQFIIGIVLYIVSPNIDLAWESGEMMTNKGFRLIGIEHPLMMFTAVILITIANAKIKRREYANVVMFVFVLLASLCFYMIPWTNWMMHR